MDLSGKVAVVTGSGRGLGLAYAKALAAAGAAVVVNDLDAEAAAAAVEEIEAAGGRGGRARSSRSATAEAADALVAARRRGVRAARRDGHQRRRAARPGAVEDDRRGLRHRHPRRTCAAPSPACARPRSGCASRARAGGSSSSARRPGSAATSARPTTPRRRPASSAMVAHLGDGARRAPGSPSTPLIPVAATAMTSDASPPSPPHRRGAGAARRAAAATRCAGATGFGTAEDCRPAGRLPRLGRRCRDHRPVHRHRRRPAGAVVAPAGGRRRLRGRRLERGRDRGRLAGDGRRPPGVLRHPRPEDLSGAVAMNSINVDELVAIDVHTHAEVSADGARLALPGAGRGRGPVLQAPTTATRRCPRSPPTTASGRWPASSSPSTPRPPPAPRPSPTRRSPRRRGATRT